MSADSARLALSEIVGEKWVEVEPFASVNLLSDWTNRFHGRPLAIVKPADTAEVSAVLKWANDNNVPVLWWAALRRLTARPSCCRCSA